MQLLRLPFKIPIASSQLNIKSLLSGKGGGGGGSHIKLTEVIVVKNP